MLGMPPSQSKHLTTLPRANVADGFVLVRVIEYIENVGMELCILGSAYGEALSDREIHVALTWSRNMFLPTLPSSVPKLPRQRWVISAGNLLRKIGDFNIIRLNLAYVQPTICDTLRNAAKPYTLTWGADPATHDHYTFGRHAGE